MWTFLTLAYAGNLSLELDLAGEKTKLEIDDMAPCLATTFERRDFPDLLKVVATVTPRDEGELVVSVEISRRTHEGDAQVAMSPSLVMRDGGRGTLTVRAAEEVARVSVSATGFAGVSCPGDVPGR